MFIAAPAALMLSCKPAAQGNYTYRGTINPSMHRHLDGKKIFIDPGHGARSSVDGRVGPSGLREEEVNLKVATILGSICSASGAVVKLSRVTDVELSLDDRVKMAVEFKPDIFISIHHNGNPRPKDRVNYPSILIWGNRDENPASYDLADLAMAEFNKSFDSKGIIASDYAVFRETGTQLLRETRELCPGILGEFGFFTDKDFEVQLKEELFNVTEAESYFRAVSEYFKRGIPTATLITDAKISDPEGQLPVYNRSPRIAIRINSGIDKPGIYPGSLRVTLNDLEIPVKRIDDKTYQLDYGSLLYPGGSRVRFSFRNPRFQSSMVLTAGLGVGFGKGEYDGNIAAAVSLIDRGSPREGLYRLLPALYAGFTDPKGDVITYNIARAFDKLGDRKNAGYYYMSLNQFFPQSALRSRIPSGYLLDRHVPTDFYGKKVIWEKWDR
jgi:N-acetylmuramoyl-L-alanine amidase